MVLSEAALLFNKSVTISTAVLPKTHKVPVSIKTSNARLAKYARKLRIQLLDGRYHASVVEKSRTNYKTQKALHRQLVRRIRMQDNIKRDKLMHSVLESDPSKFFKLARSSRMLKTEPIKQLIVRHKVYDGDQVCDGFFDSISYLKTKAHKDLEACDVFSAANEEYNNILKICHQGPKIPQITLEQTKKILFSLRPAVSDYASITANHYRHAGEPGLAHLHSLVIGIIDDMNNLAVDELNIVSACILHKRHGKPKSLAESYRTISSCPFIYRVLDARFLKVCRYDQLRRNSCYDQLCCNSC